MVTKWELANPSKVEEFVKFSSELSTIELAEMFGMAKSTCMEVKKRLGLVVSKTVMRIKIAKKVTVEVLNEEEQRLKKRLREIEDERINLKVHVEMTKADMVIITGLASEPIEVDIDQLREFVKGHGLAKMREMSSVPGGNHGQA